MQRILNPIGESSTPPRIARARGRPAWEGDDSGAALLDEAGFTRDPFAQPESESEFDQHVAWWAASWRLWAGLLPVLCNPLNLALSGL